MIGKRTFDMSYYAKPIANYQLSKMCCGVLRISSYVRFMSMLIFSKEWISWGKL